MKNFISASILSASAALSWCHDPNVPLNQTDSGRNLSSLHAISPEEANKTTGLMATTNGVVEGLINGVCNYARVEYALGEIYTATALHCAAIKWDKDQDMLLAKHLEATVRKLTGNVNLVVQRVTDNPEPLSLSDYNQDTVVGEMITAVWCFPDKKQFWCYTITGTVHEKWDERFIFLDQEDFERIFKNNTLDDRTTLNGMSGSPVLDKYGKYVGNLSRVYMNRWGGDTYAIGITTVRDWNGNIKNIH